MMFENETTINEFLIGLFQKTVVDLSDESLYQPGAGHGHPPIWVLGHLAIVGEFGEQMLGGTVTHPEWLPWFSPGNSDTVPSSLGLTKQIFVEQIPASYDRLRGLAKRATKEHTDKPHEIGILAGTPIRTIGHCVALILTNHFGFHLAQLSSCRRSQGFSALF